MRRVVKNVMAFVPVHGVRAQFPGRAAVSGIEQRTDFGPPPHFVRRANKVWLALAGVGLPARQDHGRRAIGASISSSGIPNASTSSSARGASFLQRSLTSRRTASLLGGSK